MKCQVPTRDWQPRPMADRKASASGYAKYRSGLSSPQPKVLWATSPRQRKPLSSPHPSRAMGYMPSPDPQGRAWHWSKRNRQFVGIQSTRGQGVKAGQHKSWGSKPLAQAPLLHWTSLTKYKLKDTIIKHLKTATKEHSTLVWALSEFSHTDCTSRKPTVTLLPNQTWWLC